MSSDKRSNKEVNSESTSRLELESQRMEDRLRILKQMMSIEKIQREASNGQNSHWKSGQRGPLTTKRPSDINTTEKKTATKSHKSVKVKVLTGKEPEGSHQNSYRVQCGQCELYRASMVCVECVENYCNVCFAKFHQKGSLSKHHVRPLSRALVKECPKPTVTNTQSTGPSQDYTYSNSLLTGTYDEAASAESFQVALRAWRTSNKEQETTTNKDVSSITTTSCGVQASSSSTSTSTKPVNITFTTSPTKASYFDRILLKKLKNNPSFLEPHTSTKKPTKSPVVEEYEDFETATKSIVSPYNIFYSNENNTQDTGYNISLTEGQCDELDRHYNGSLLLPPQSQQSSNVTIENALLTEHNSLCQDPNVSKVNEVTSQSSISLTCTTTTVTNKVSSVKKVSHKSIKKSKSLKTTTESKVKSNAAFSSEITDSLMSTSIQQAWRECSQLKYTTKTPHDLSCFFLTSVNKQSSLHDVPSHTQIHDTSTEWNTNTLSSTLWLPSSSIIEESDKMASQEDSQPQFDISHSDLPPPTSIVHNSSSAHYLEPVASETDSDDNEVFLSDSEEEREKEDQSALEDLAWELASLCDNNESVRETVIDVEDEERVWSCLTMDELIHDFEQFQDKIKEQDNL